MHGEDVWRHREARPEESAVFDRAMESITHGGTESVLEAFDFGRFRLIVDVAGGTGAFLAAILERYPDARGILFDQPHVVRGAVVPERVEVVAGSFFDAVPAGGDAYVLKAIVHDWEDEESIAILRACREAIAPDGSLLVVERLLGAPNERPEAKFSDLNMMVAPGGRERTLEEYGALFEAAGFRLVGETADVERPQRDRGGAGLAGGGGRDERGHELRGVDRPEAAREVVAGDGREAGHVVREPVGAVERADVVVAARDVDDPVVAGQRVEQRVQPAERLAGGLVRERDDPGELGRCGARAAEDVVRRRSARHSSSRPRPRRRPRRSG